MAERYRRSSKSSQNLRDESTRSVTKKYKQSHNERSKKSHLECKTPPLPKRKDTSIEDLLKERQSLKEELKKIGKHTSIECNSKNTQVSTRSDHTYKKSEYHRRKRHSSSLHEDDHKRSKKALHTDNEPDLHAETQQVDSEDEENIIEERRKQRKQLLEKLQHSNDDNVEKIEKIHNDSKKFAKVHVTKSIKNDIKPVNDKTDMFSENYDFAPDNVTQDNSESNAVLNDNWDDEEGYYNIKVGDMINQNRYTIKALLGQGVFANVVRASDNTQNSDVAIKIVRNNDLMYRTGLKEIALLKEINDADPENRYHCIRYLRYFMHKGHLCLVLESLYMDLRSVLRKYGKNHGINMKALMSYSRQLLMAVRLLKKIGIIHADIKPDNILVNEKKNVLKLCDFGSASKIDDNEPTPYLVSRFYRAPEIILGLQYSHGVDLWAAACTIYEMTTGKIMFTGSSNNKMLKCFMDLKGKISSKLVRKGKFKDQHFNYNNNFLLHKKDEASGREKYIEMTNILPKRDLLTELKKSCKYLYPDEDKKIGQLRDMLDRMIMFDPRQRISVSECLNHAFIQDELKTK